ncbi:SDR family oxidoreductase [Roseibacterium sp. SDUM158016]|uniref:SDR family oxidoreductase n=1 Tax=Roseicyclus sediminis TaxID=2980997 RepID=UPI0021D19EB5|nr:SDR family oxidoreductase [Roseibacterium sp. SDUM158016]MCU4652770.1 SDR family oxidoreductase [Roseibacterium sp. SDUM158016]
MKSVFVAGATGYLGRHLCREFSRRGWYVTALVRNAARAGDLDADTLVEAEATRAETLRGAMEGADLVVSALGITRQADGLGYRDVDYGANLNLLAEARRAGVGRFAYVHVLNASRMPGVPLVAAKADFVVALQASDIASTIVAPSGFFSDMQAFFDMARAGRAWLFGSGTARINPIHGADLARALVDAVEAGRGWIDVGGPETFTQSEIAALAFAALGKPVRITRLPDMVRRTALRLLPFVTPRKVHGPAQFFLTAMAMDMVGAPTGSRSLARHFSDLAAKG